MGRITSPEEARERQLASAKARVHNRLQREAIAELVKAKTIPIDYKDLTPAQQAVIDALLALREEAEG